MLNQGKRGGHSCGGHDPGLSYVSAKPLKKDRKKTKNAEN